MTATITFHANGSDGTESLIDHQASVASGIGFYGDGFGQSVAMDTPQSTTFIPLFISIGCWNSQQKPCRSKRI